MDILTQSEKSALLKSDDKPALFKEFEKHEIAFQHKFPSISNYSKSKESEPSLKTYNAYDKYLDQAEKL